MNATSLGQFICECEDNFTKCETYHQSSEFLNKSVFLTDNVGVSGCSAEEVPMLQMWVEHGDHNRPGKCSMYKVWYRSRPTGSSQV